MKYLATFFLVLGLMGMLFGLVSCDQHRVDSRKREQGAPPTLDTPLKMGLISIVGGVASLGLAEYLYGRARKKGSKPPK